MQACLNLERRNDNAEPQHESLVPERLLLRQALSLCPVSDDLLATLRTVRMTSCTRYQGWRFRSESSAFCYEMRLALTMYSDHTISGGNAMSLLADTGKRHPTLGSNVLVGAGAAIRGPVFIGNNVRIAAGSVALRCLPDNVTAAGVPAIIVRRNGEKVNPSNDLNQRDVPDLFGERLAVLEEKLLSLEKRQKP